MERAKARTLIIPVMQRGARAHRTSTASLSSVYPWLSRVTSGRPPHNGNEFRVRTSGPKGNSPYPPRSGEDGMAKCLWLHRATPSWFASGKLLKCRRAKIGRIRAVSVELDTAGILKTAVDVIINPCLERGSGYRFICVSAKGWFIFPLKTWDRHRMCLTELACPREEHRLRSYRAPTNVFTCKVCSSHIPSSAQFYRCPSCRFDVCTSCQVVFLRNTVLYWIKDLTKHKNRLKKRLQTKTNPKSNALIKAGKRFASRKEFPTSKTTRPKMPTNLMQKENDRNTGNREIGNSESLSELRKEISAVKQQIQDLNIVLQKLGTSPNGGPFVYAVEQQLMNMDKEVFKKMTQLATKQLYKDILPASQAEERGAGFIHRLRSAAFLRVINTDNRNPNGTTTTPKSEPSAPIARKSFFPSSLQEIFAVTRSSSSRSLGNDIPGHHRDTPPGSVVGSGPANSPTQHHRSSTRVFVTKKSSTPKQHPSSSSPPQHHPSKSCIAQEEGSDTTELRFVISES